MLYHLGRQCQKIKNFLCQYCHETSLHGFKYVVSNESSSTEKIAWALVCIIGLTLSALLMSLIWQRFRRTPTVTTIDTTTYPIFGLNFPAVSICNYNKVYKPHADRLSDEMRQKGLTNEEIEDFFTTLPRLIRQDYVDADFSKVIQLITTAETNIEEIMSDMMQPCEKLLLRCSWEGQRYDCSKIFKPVKTPEGFCCAFNYHVDDTENSPYKIRKKIKNVTSEVKRNLTKEEPGVHEPLTVPGAGRDMGISVVIDLEENTYFGSIRPSVGASILVHDPFNYPEVEVLTSFIQPMQEMAVMLSGSIVASEANVKTLDLTRRNCWFNDEVKLSISSVYSYQSCITECRIRYIRRYCNCVPFFYPNYYQARTCSLDDINCLTKNRGSLSNLRTIIDVVNENDTRDSAKCDCLPSCNDTTYTSNSENTIMSNVSFHSPLLQGFDVKKVSLASVYFRGITCLKYRKEIWMSWDDLLASFGGIFGLCVGGSFVSLVEILYFFIKKLWRRSDQSKQATLANSPPAREKFKVVSIDQLRGWSHKKLDNDSAHKRNVSSRENFTYPAEIKSATMKPSSINEEFIRY
ncbi:pickpocket protein 28-like, partial [Phymastichus coffea]|uniref:pickpocket protein 28-like n=1 Tax=Phymastichus coffea TaxID=108790 RepID=UPI00273C6674